MTAPTPNGDAWWLLEANPDQFAHLEHLYARQLTGTAPRRHCRSHPGGSEHCSACQLYGWHFDRWIAQQ